MLLTRTGDDLAVRPPTRCDPPMSTSVQNRPQPHANDASACEDLCQEHWLRLCHLARLRGCDPQTAQDAVQEVFLSLLRRGVLPSLSGKPAAIQASYLSMRLRCVLINRWRDARRQRRGSPDSLLSIDAHEAIEPATQETPATHHDNAWLGRCLATAFDRLRSQTPAIAWQQVQPILLEEATPPQSGSQRAAVYRARQKLRLLVQEEMNGSFTDWSSQLRGVKPALTKTS